MGMCTINETSDLETVTQHNQAVFCLAHTARECPLPTMVLSQSVLGKLIVASLAPSFS